MFLQQSVNEGGIPFQPRGKRPNAETIAAMEELERGGGIRMTLEEFSAYLKTIEP
jgi:antitoxin component of RelBE/YafQ-DinJ toxin-antitoxin module